MSPVQFPVIIMNKVNQYPTKFLGFINASDVNISGRERVKVRCEWMDFQWRRAFLLLLLLLLLAAERSLNSEESVLFSRCSPLGWSSHPVSPVPPVGYLSTSFPTHDDPLSHAISALITAAKRVEVSALFPSGGDDAARNHERMSLFARPFKIKVNYSFISVFWGILFRKVAFPNITVLLKDRSIPLVKIDECIPFCLTTCQTCIAMTMRFGSIL